MLAAKARGVTNTFFLDYQVWRTRIYRHSFSMFVCHAIRLKPMHLAMNIQAELDGCKHPGVVGHAQMASIAQPIIASALGWN